MSQAIKSMFQINAKSFIFLGIPQPSSFHHPFWTNRCVSSIQQKHRTPAFIVSVVDKVPLKKFEIKLIISLHFKVDSEVYIWPVTEDEMYILLLVLNASIQTRHNGMDNRHFLPFFLFLNLLPLQCRVAPYNLNRHSTGNSYTHNVICTYLLKGCSVIVSKMIKTLREPFSFWRICDIRNRFSQKASCRSTMKRYLPGRRTCKEH